MLQRYFDERIVENEETGCWLWTGKLYKDGYGRVNCLGKSWRAHRVSWELYHGPVPEDLWVLHTCDVPYCVNPDHLWLGKHADNQADKIRKGRHRHTDETRAKMSAAHIGQKHPPRSAEFRRRKSEAMKGKQPPHNDNWRAAIREANKKRWDRWHDAEANQRVIPRDSRNAPFLTVD